LFCTEVLKDCVYLELSDRTIEPFEVLAKATHYDEIGKVVFDCYKEEIPMHLIKWFMAEVEKENWPI